MMQCSFVATPFQRFKFPPYSRSNMRSEMVPVYEANYVTLQFIVNCENLRAHGTGILGICGFLACFVCSLSLLF